MTDGAAVGSSTAMTGGAAVGSSTAMNFGVGGALVGRATGFTVAKGTDYNQKPPDQDKTEPN